MPAIVEIEKKLRDLVQYPDWEIFTKEFFADYGLPKTSLAAAKRLGGADRLISRQRYICEHAENAPERLTELIADEAAVKKYKPRFLIATDCVRFSAYDVQRKERLDIAFTELPGRYEFFLPWCGIEPYQAHEEHPADIKAAEKMASIYDEIVKANPNLASENPHALNVFLTRLLFCFFAEDTGIFPGENLFTKSVSDHTELTGRDTAAYLKEVFTLFDIDTPKREGGVPEHLRAFPYVNGSLFSEQLEIPRFTAKARALLRECGELDWRLINPDIFGSMFQAVARRDVRSRLGQHYTSISNIMKVIEPLFLNDLYDAFHAALGAKPADRLKKLNALRQRLADIRIFDPACGSGNFLIIAYKQLRNLEAKILEEICKLDVRGGKSLFSGIQLDHFYGIEIDDFACEIARLSLWLAEHQMNLKFRDTFGTQHAPLPLQPTGQIVCGNAARLDWEKVCPKRADGKEREIYVLGNPPYLGTVQQNDDQKKDMDDLFRGTEHYRNLDYISCWFYKAAAYITGAAETRFAFVTTNSVCQGQQLGYLWEKVLNDSIEIFFAHQSFKWMNNAKRNAGVTCVIIGMANKSNHVKTIFSGERQQVVASIPPSLRAEENKIAVQKEAVSISGLPTMDYGNKPTDGGHLLLSPEEKEIFLKANPDAEKFVRPILGSREYIRGLKRFCLWIYNEDLEEALSYPFIKKRVEKVKDFRLASSKKATREAAQKAYAFDEIRLPRYSKNTLIIPRVSSERREYIPVGFLDAETIVSDSAFAIYDAPLWVFGVLTSRIHMVWMRAVAGRLETRYRYSNVLCYNTFPFPRIAKEQRDLIEKRSSQLLRIREKYAERTLAELYDPDKMPADLRKAHQELDLCVDACYPDKPFADDEDRLASLFNLYSAMKKNESAQK